MLPYRRANRSVACLWLRITFLSRRRADESVALNQDEGSKLKRKEGKKQCPGLALKKDKGKRIRDKPVVRDT